MDATTIIIVGVLLYFLGLFLVLRLGKWARKNKIVTLIMGREVYQKIQSIRVLAELMSVGEVIRRALSVYAFLQEQKAKGNVLIVRYDDGEEKEVDLR